MLLTDAHTHRPPDSPDRIALVDLTPADRPEKISGKTFFSCGIHPADADRFTLDELRRAVREIPVAAIGECGLDPLAAAPLDRQETIFREQAELAGKLRLPMVIHCVRKPYELIRIRKSLKIKTPWLIHGFRGGREVAEAWLRNGCLLSLSAPWLMHLTTFPDWLPERSFLLETDDCSLSLPEIYRHAASLLEKPADRLAAESEDTFRHFLGLPAREG